MSDSVPKIPDFVTQVTRDEDNEDYSGGISARRIPGEEPDLPQYEDDYGSSSSSAPANDSIFSRIFCCFGGGGSSSSSTAKALPPIPPGGKYLLPPQFPHHKGRKCLVLDLDETLVHSSFRPVPNADFVIPVEIEDTVHQVYVSKRPNVDEFMRKMGEIYEIVIFTASLNKYADPVLDLLDIHKVVAHRLFRDSCCNNRGNYVKDMARLGRVMSQSIIIDNSPTSFMFQPELAIAIDSWFDDINDTELDQLVPFLTELASADDVRPGLREWAQKKQWKG